MNIGDLKRMIEQYPDDMEIVTERYSDYWIVEEDEWFVVDGVQNTAVGYVMRAHPTMSDENKALVNKYLALKGN